MSDIVKLVRHVAEVYLEQDDSDPCNLFNWIENWLTKKQLKLPIFKLLPKLHKKPVVGRPIIASHSYATTPLSIVLDDLLQPVVQGLPTTLKDSRSLIMLLEKLVIDKSDAVTPNSSDTESVWLITGDVKSLYTAIPNGDGLKRVLDLLKELGFSRWAFAYDALKVILECNYFEFNEQLFQQLEGAAMGAAVAPCYANLFMYTIERPLLVQFKRFLLLYKRLIDDLFAIFRGTKANLDRFLKALKSLHDRIEIAVTVSEMSVDFLDITIFKGERFNARRVLDVKPFEKSMNPYLYIPFTSAHPKHLKRAWIKTELMRLARNSSSRDEFQRANERFYARLKARGYPDDFLRNVMDKQFCLSLFRDRQELLKERKAAPTTRKMFFKIKYSPDLDHIQLGRILHQNWTEELTQLVKSEPSVCYKKADTIAKLLKSKL
jgi:hypothetical protein